MADLLTSDRVSARLHPATTVAIGGDYLTEEQAAALGRFLESLHRRQLRREQAKTRKIECQPVSAQ